MQGFIYKITEEGHHFHLEENGKYYRISKIYRETLDRSTGKLLDRYLQWNNHSEDFLLSFEKCYLCHH